MILGSRRIDVRLRLIALVLLVIAATAAGFVLWIVRRVGVYGRAAVIDGFGAQFVVAGDLA